MEKRIECEVAVVGAGLAGLSAARELQRDGIDVGVLEARNEVGGRVRSRTFDGRVVELGGTFLSRRQWRMVRLAGELGLTVRPTGLWGRRIRWHAPEPSIGPVPRMTPADIRGLLKAGIDARRRARHLDPDCPWEGPDSAGLDRISVADWIEHQRIGGTARWLLGMAIGGYASQPVERLSLLQYLWWVSRYGGNLPALRTGNSFYVAEGAQQIALRMAAGLRRATRLHTPIDEIAQSGSSVEIGSDGEVVCIARLAIVTAPLAAIGRIGFNPSLPDELNEAHERLQSGHITKLGAVTHAPAVDAHRCVIGGSPLAWTMRFDSELIGYGLRPAAGVEGTELLALLARDYGLSRDSIRGEAVNWTEEPFSNGSYVAFAPGQITRHAAALRQAHGLVHFAGAERSSMPQQMEGALESGKRAADAAREALRERRVAVAVP